MRAASAPPPVAEIPFSWTKTGQIELPVSVNGGRPVPFLLDTGAEFSIVSTAVAKSLRLPLEQRLGRDFADGVSLAFGGIRLANQAAMVMSFESYRRRGRVLEGFIGYDFFARYVVEIDFEKARLRLWKPSRFAPAATAAKVPIQFVRRVPSVPVTFELPDRKPLRANVVIDTGASQTLLLRHPFAARHGLLELATKEKTTTAGSLASGEIRLVRLPARRLRFASWTFEQPFVMAFREAAGSGGATDSDGILGNELLRRFRVTLDYSRNMIALEPNERLREPFGR